MRGTVILHVQAIMEIKFTRVFKTENSVRRDMKDSLCTPLNFTIFGKNDKLFLWRFNVQTLKVAGELRAVSIALKTLFYLLDNEKSF